MRRVHVHIDELVLRGVAYEDRRAVAAAIERELVRRLAAPGVADEIARLGHVERLPSARVHVAPGAKPAELGVAAARGVSQVLPPGKLVR